MMSMTKSRLPSNVTISKAANGDVVIQNDESLASSPANLGEWLRSRAKASSERFFLKERDVNGEWQGITYAQTLAKVNQLSNGLLARGFDDVGPIAVLSENCIDMALLQLAAMQVGLPVVPISYAYSVRSQDGSHLKHILDMTNARVLIMSDADVHMPKFHLWDTGDLTLFAFSVGKSYRNVNRFEELFEENETLSNAGQRLFDSVSPDTLGKIQFTSGSTKLPKGVQVTHGMMVSNQVGIAQMWSFWEPDEVVVDWLPWNHTFGGNFIFNMVLMRGGTLYIDHGNPAPHGISTTIKNILDVSPTVFFGVPRSFSALHTHMQENHVLQEAFFQRLKCLFTAAAALDQSTFIAMSGMSVRVRGERVPFYAGWGSTETAPTSTLVYWTVDDARMIGLPIPSVKIKLATLASGKRELRVKGPNVTPGYYNDPRATAQAFDEEGYYCTGDAGDFWDADHSSFGLIFAGRISEDFKLSSGVWVHNGQLRSMINELGQPFLLDVVIAAPKRDYLSALVFPNIQHLRGHFSEASRRYLEDADFLQTQQITDFFREIFLKHNAVYEGSSTCIQRFTLISELPRMDKNEMTDKGYINQFAVLEHRAKIVDSLYAEPTLDHIVAVGR